MRITLILLGALLPALAWAQPPLLAVAVVIGFQAAGVALAAVAFAGISYGTLIFVSTMVYGVVKARNDGKKAARAARDSYNAGVSDRNVSIVSADNPWQVILGRATVGPAYVAVLTSGDKDQFKHVVAVWAAHQCDAIEDISIAGVSIGALDGAGMVTGGKFFKGSTESAAEAVTISGAGVMTVARTVGAFLVATYTVGSGDSESVSYISPDMVTVSGSTITLNPEFVAFWAGREVAVRYEWASGTARLRVRHHLGTSGQTADADLLADLPSEWSSSDRLRGLTYSVFRFDLNEPEFQGGPPQLRATIRGALVYDYRTATTAWSDNAALCVAHYLRAEYGMRATSAQVLSAPAIIAADACDDTVVTGSVGRARYTCNGSFRTDGDPGAVLDQLCQAMAGFATFTGAWHLQAGVYTAPVAALTDADNAGSIEIVAAPAGDEVFNGVRGRFFDPARFNEMTDYPPYQNTAFKAEDDDTDLWASLDLPYTDSALRCHHLARIFTERSRGMQLVYPAKLRALQLKVGQRITLTCAWLAIDAQVFRIVKREYRLGQAVMLTLQQDDPTLYDSVDAPASLDSPSQPGFDPFVVAAPVALTATSNAGVTLYDDDGTVISRVRLTYEESADALVLSGGALQIEHRLDNTTAWQRAPEAPGSSTQTALQGLKDARVYVIRARWRNGLGAVSDWRSTTVLTAAPSDIGAASLRLNSTGLAFTFDGAGTASPAVQTVTLEALLSNIGGVATFTATRFDASGTSLGAATLGGAGTNIRTLTAAEFDDAAYCVVSAERTGYSDQVTLFRLTSGGISRAVIYIYKRDTSPPALPTADALYTFATNALTGLNNGWTATVPSGSNALYVAVGSASGTDPTDTIAGTEWTTPVVLVPASGGAGADGANTGTVFLFQRTTTSTAPSLPSAAITYTFSGGVLSGLTNGWLAAVPASGGGYLWVTTATAFSSSGSDSIPTTEWAAARIMAKDGEAASAGFNTATVLIYKRASSPPAVPSATATYTFATATLTGLNNGWTSSVPSGSLPLWVASASAVDVDADDTIATGEWTTPVVMAQDGSDGGNSATVLLFKRTATTTPPAVPSTSLTYTFATALLSGTLSGWTQSVPDITGGAYLWVTSATAFTNQATDTIPNTEWAAPQQMAVNGAAAPLLKLLSTAQAYTYNTAGTASPSSQTISLTAYLANLTGTATWGCTLYNSAGTSLGAGTLGGSGNTRTLTVANFGAAAYAVVTATLSGFADQVTLVRLKDGAAGVTPITGFLSNESHTVATATDGSGGSYTSAGGDFKVYSGTTEITSGVTYSVVSSSGITAMAITSGGIYSLTGTTADTGTATLRAVYGGVTIDKVYTISRSRAGLDGLAGADSPLLVLLSTAQVFTFDTDNAASPASQTISLTAYLANLSGTATFTCTRYSAAGASLGTVTLGGAGNTRTLTVAQFGAAAYAVVTASLSGRTDQMTLVRLKDGAAGVTPITGFLSNESHTVSTAANGTGGVYTAAGGDFKVYNGITEVTSGVTYSVVASSGITAMAITSGGIYSLTGTTADTGTATLRAVYGGVTIDKIYTISRSKTGAAGADGADGSNGTDGTDGSDAQLLTVHATAEQMTFDTENDAVPLTQTITFRAQLANISGAVTWVATKFNIDGGSLGTFTLGGTGNTGRTMTVAQFGVAAYVVVSASLAGFSDQVFVVRVITGPPASRVTPFGASVTAIRSAILSAATAVIRLNNDGTTERQINGGTFTAVDNWYTPTTVGIGSSYRVRVLDDGDALAAGTVDGYVALSGSPLWRLSTPAGSYAEKLNRLTLLVSTNSSETPASTNYVTLYAVWEP